MTPDVIVVGAGSAGCALASRLSENPSLNVLLLEAGPGDSHPFVRIPAASGMAISSPRFNWMYPLEPDESLGGRADIWPAGRCLGGGSAINGMMFIRGHRWDYDHWASLGNPGWDYESVLPYFKRLETNERGADEWRGDSGPLSVADPRVESPLIEAWVDACVELGIERCGDLNGKEPAGVDVVQASQRRGWRHSSARAYLQPASRRKNLAVQTECQVTRVLFEQGAAKGVEYQRAGATHVASASAGVVLSAGSIGSPKLLMLSGVGDAELLRRYDLEVVQNSSGVGRNLQEHPGVRMTFDAMSGSMGADTGGLRNLIHGANFLLRGRGPLSSGIGHAQAFVSTSSDFELPNVQIIMSPFTIDFDEQGAQLNREQTFGCAVGVMRPRSRGSVTLRSANPMEKPIIAHELLGEQIDVDQLIDGCRMLRDIVTQPALEPYFKKERLPGKETVSDELWATYLREQSFPMYHPVGTCKMGADEQAVVDHELRVKGVDKLWVADASIMPTLPSGNTNATAIMIGEKGADLIANALQ